MPPQTAIVTGGASGIGLAIVKSLAQTYLDHNSHVAILDINVAAGVEVASALSLQHSTVTFSFHQCDVSSWSSQAAVFDEVYARHGHVDIVCANAGIPEQGSLFMKGETPEKPNLRTLDIDLTAVIYTTSLGAFYMSKNEPSAENGFRGSIICTASNAGFYPLPLAPIYTTAKHGVVGLVRGFAPRLAHEKIQLNGFAPCIVETHIGASLKMLPGIVFTPLETVAKAVQTILSDSTLVGKIAEVSEDRVTWAEPPAFVDGSTKKNLEILGGLAQNIWSGMMASQTHGP
ncbi:hypothetical protein CKM354_000778400 [Cercospora kikuchii]|uniref:Uncharacterized protein n=1 Tax=Cercospora kikuchii TaxID=84275 RepID=A0A9P3CRT2_9PEZI|nr:uncharacterized protein CKM354_000778400 [Cercospora kikuchii]GIZ44590.1 hypothetical protein CKM354_000778400 [Cercospora kikuchii]